MLIKFIRYNLVQIAAYALELLVFLLMMKAWNHIISSNVVAKIMAAIFAFILHKHFTFNKSKTKKFFKEAFKYFAILPINILLGTFILVIISDLLTQQWLSKILSDIFGVGVSFLLVHYIVFKDPKKTK